MVDTIALLIDSIETKYAILAVSDFESIRKEHIHKQISFVMRQVANVLETKFDIRVQESSYQNR